MTSFLSIVDNFGENLLNSIITTSFVRIQQEITKLKRGEGHKVFKIAHNKVEQAHVCFSYIKCKYI